MLSLSLSREKSVVRSTDHLALPQLLNHKPNKQTTILTTRVSVHIYILHRKPEQTVSGFSLTHKHTKSCVLVHFNQNDQKINQ